MSSVTASPDSPDDSKSKPAPANPAPANPVKALKPRPAELPANIEDWTRFLSTERTINDYVEEIHRTLVKSSDYRDLLYACYDEQAVEGSLSADNTIAAKMIRDKAIEIVANTGEDNMIVHEKLATISKSLGVVLRRYHSSRRERRQSVGGQSVPEDNNS